MKPEQAVYRLGRVINDPRYEGFFVKGYASLDSIPLFPGNKNWKVTRLARDWAPLKVMGRVRPSNDYPCVNRTFPAFSGRGVEALREFLEPNGQLLSLKSRLGSYSAYNLTTVVAALNVTRSNIQWYQKPTAVDLIVRHEFIPSRIRSLSIFRIPQDSSSVYVTRPFVNRSLECGLRGMVFSKVWPLTGRKNWLQLEREQEIKHETAGMAPGRTLTGNTVVICLSLSDPKSKGTAPERTRVGKLMKALDRDFLSADLDDPFIGEIGKADYSVRGEARLYICCPDAVKMCKRLVSTLRQFDWPNECRLLKQDKPRYAPL